MEIRQLTPGLAVAGQIEPGDVADIAARGFRAIVNNRPDGEGESQPASSAIAAEARRLGLGYRHIPITPGMLGDDKVAAFAAALAEGEGPVLAFCRTGTRSASLWALAEAARRDPDAILRTAAAAGYDLRALQPRLRSLAAAGAGAPPGP